MKEYLIEYTIGAIVKKNGKDVTRKGKVVIKASSAFSAKHKFYAKHSCSKGYAIKNIFEQKRVYKKETTNE